MHTCEVEWKEGRMDGLVAVGQMDNYRCMSGQTKGWMCDYMCGQISLCVDSYDGKLVDVWINGQMDYCKYP